MKIDRKNRQMIRKWFRESNLEGICSLEDSANVSVIDLEDSTLFDLIRVAFASCFDEQMPLELMSLLENIFAEDVNADEFLRHFGLADKTPEELLKFVTAQENYQALVQYGYRMWEKGSTSKSSKSSNESTDRTYSGISEDFVEDTELFSSELTDDELSDFEELYYEEDSEEPSDDEELEAEIIEEIIDIEADNALRLR